jgi:RND family efflux transporter MFP subunit
MELVPASSGGSGDADERSLRIDPASRRVANIRTAPVEGVVASRPIRAIGQLSYDEGRLKTLAAYVDGRLDRLYADYTGVVVHQGDELALLYSPQLYTAQAELLSAKQAAERRQASRYSEGLNAGSLYDSARRKLLDWGMTASQIAQLEETGQPDTRITLVAPIHGTVVEKLASEGEYVKTGQPIYRLADLSRLWLMLELFPADAAAIRYGQRVEAEVQSLPGVVFAGRVAFVDPTVDPRTRTVGVRVVVANEEGRLRVGDYATATVEVPLTGPTESEAGIFDAELAGKWISPRHPHVVEDQPGSCRECGIPLVPAATLGFADEPVDRVKQLVVPRHAVLMAGDHSVVYVEAEPGRFELRQVKLGPTLGDRIVLLSGVEQGENVATNGNFLIDSQMQLAGKPSLIDPTRAEPKRAEPGRSPEVLAALAELPADDRAAAERQKTCPVAGMPLGSMGTPIKVDVQGTPVFICCEGCRGSLLAEPEKYLAKLGGDTEP